MSQSDGEEEARAAAREGETGGASPERAMHVRDGIDSIPSRGINAHQSSLIAHVIIDLWTRSAAEDESPSG